MRLIPLSTLARRLGVAPCTLVRWRIDGLRGGSLRLRARKIGGRWHSSTRWLKAFLAACEVGAPPVTVVEPPGERNRRIGAALAEAEARGLR